uniref:DUF1618 domain-containing protein n=1 Tax=Oryza barthii TaxID=65489 RepID=A0A0D3HA90_9ORYZ
MPKLPNYFPILEKLHVGHPVLSLHIDHLAHKAWILPIDLRNGTVGICETYIQTTISIYPRRKRRHRRPRPALLDSQLDCL